MSLAITVLATACALIILARCICVIDRMNHRAAGVNYLHFLAFGVAYILLLGASLGAMFHVWESSASGKFNVSNLMFLGAFAVMILFDRRAERGPCQPPGWFR